MLRKGGYAVILHVKIPPWSSLFSQNDNRFLFPNRGLALLACYIRFRHRLHYREKWTFQHMVICNHHRRTSIEKRHGATTNVHLDIKCLPISHKSCNCLCQWLLTGGPCERNHNIMLSSFGNQYMCYNGAAFFHSLYTCPSSMFALVIVVVQPQVLEPICNWRFFFHQLW